MRGWGALALSVCVAALGCRGETVNAPASEDATADTDAASPAAGELLANSGFELGCTGWGTAEANAEDSTTARSGTRSCRVCGTSDAYFFFQEIAGPFEPGAQYAAEAWLRADPGEAGVAPDPRSRLECFDEGNNQIFATESSALGLDATWKRTSTLITVKPGTHTLSFSLWSHGAGTCFLIDDASVRRLP